MLRTLHYPMLWLAAALLVAGCTPPPGAGEFYDPHEQVNRRTHAFNVELDEALFGGMRGESAPPRELLIAVSNFSGNLGLPSKVLNSVLQGRAEPAVANTFRFLINSSLGLGGLFDPAGNSFGLYERDTDFGETLHVWGVGEGAYVELPVLGPSTERDAFGKVVDTLIDPLGFVANADQRVIVRLARITGKGSDRLRFGASVDSILHGSADSYAQSRLLYLQNRRYELGSTDDVNAFDPYEQ
jgi:phospholipid-binding lipoprotein MlaA